METKGRKPLQNQPPEESSLVDSPDGNITTKQNAREGNGTKEKAVKDRKAMVVWEKLQHDAQQRVRKEEAARKASERAAGNEPGARCA